MKHELGPTQRAVEFLYSIGLPPLRILRGLITLGLISLVMAGVYFVAFSGLLDREVAEVVEEVEEFDEAENEAPVESPEPASERTTYEFELSLDQQIDELYFGGAEDKNYVVFAGEVEKQNKTIEALKQRNDLTAEQAFKLDRVLLRNGQEFLVRKLNARVFQPQDAVEFRTLANSLKSGQNEKLSDLASYALVNVGADIFLKSPTEQNASDLVQTFSQNKSSFLNDVKRTNAILAKLMKLKETDSRNKLADKTIEAFGQLLSQSNAEAVKLISDYIDEYSLFAGLDLQSLEEQVRFQAPNALQDLDDALRVLEAHPEVDLPKWKLLIRAYEPALSIGKQSVFETGWKIASGLVNQLPDSDERKSELQTILKKQVARARMVGSTVDLSGKHVSGGAISFPADYTLLVFSDRSTKSMALMGQLRGDLLEGSQFYTPIVSFKDDFTAEDMERLDQIPRGIQISSFESAKNYAKKFSIDYYPYVVLLDKQNIVIDVDLSLVQAANRVAALRTKKSAASVRPKKE